MEEDICVLVMETWGGFMVGVKIEKNNKPSHFVPCFYILLRNSKADDIMIAVSL